MTFNVHANELVTRRVQYSVGRTIKCASQYYVVVNFEYSQLKFHLSLDVHVPYNITMQGRSAFTDFY